MHSILVVDDELSIRESFSLILEGKYKILLAASGEAALKTISDQKADLAFLDIRMPGMDGLETLKRLKAIDPELEIVMVTAVNDVQKASEAIKFGARDYVVKPFDIEHISRLVEQILRKKALFEQGSETQKKAQAKLPELVGQTDAIASIKKTIANIKPDQPVLIMGEPGTEKETVARIIHESSPRSSFPFKTISLSKEMSAQKIKTLFCGVLEEARKGTIFIDNLRSFPEDIFNSLTPVEARLIGGANADISNKKNLFKFFSEVSIQIPPLRDRSSDLPLLANHFCEKYNMQYNQDAKIDPAVMEALANYSWPGNVKQLESLIERLILSCGTGRITLESLPFDILLESAKSSGRDFIPVFEKEYVQAVFKERGKDKEKTAKALGINTLILETKI
ncbi:MAG: sigma-54 dependent transcriptional regulator [Candidatus Margulisiibacteriota bacterium]